MPNLGILGMMETQPLTHDQELGLPTFICSCIHVHKKPKLTLKGNNPLSHRWTFKAAFAGEIKHWTTRRHIKPEQPRHFSLHLVLGHPHLHQAQRGNMSTNSIGAEQKHTKWIFFEAVQPLGCQFPQGSTLDLTVCSESTNSPSPPSPPYHHMAATKEKS